ncbi:hypothetical protein [Novosphingobium sp. BW1]|uniref:hypothetical protein n=1 Tax=Novosphingobium sp. BW1 TaxID=2592621 RepID=UPI001F07DE38|nr:hypothetical protein [Novosphingobium sp. BW1]
MPKKTDRERLADLEARQHMMAQEVEKTRRALRRKYAEIVTDLPVEDLTEREFRDLLAAAIRCGGAAALSALRALPEVSTSPQSGAPTNSKSSRRDGPATSMA